MVNTTTSNPDRATLTRHGIVGIAREILRTLFHLALLLVSAGKISWINAWVCIGLILCHQAVNTAVLMKVNPQLLNERGKLIREDTKLFDKVFVVLYVPLAVTTSIVAGLDAVRLEWSHMPLGMVVWGGALYILAAALGSWSMAANTHFETTMRIQDDRGHQVCTSGPYQIVRHPGYAAMLIGAPSYPLVLGSWWGLVPAGAMILLFVVRTALEDHTLRQELPGYEEYAGVTPYRLVPFVW